MGGRPRCLRLRAPTLKIRLVVEIGMVDGIDDAIARRNGALAAVGIRTLVATLGASAGAVACVVAELAAVEALDRAAAALCWRRALRSGRALGR